MVSVYEKKARLAITILGLTKKRTMTISELAEWINSLPPECWDIELRFDNGFGYEKISRITPKYSPDLRKADKPMFFAIS